MLRTTNDEALSTLTTENKKNKDAPTSTSSGGVGRSFENLSTAAKLAKSKKSKSTKSKKSDLPKAKFAKVNSGTDFLILEAKKAFIHLQKAFTKTPIFRHFNAKCHIRIETDGLGYAIGGVVSQITSDQYSSGHVIYEESKSDYPKSEIGQWHPVAICFER